MISQLKHSETNEFFPNKINSKVQKYRPTIRNHNIKPGTIKNVLTLYILRLYLFIHIQNIYVETFSLQVYTH